MLFGHIYWPVGISYNSQIREIAEEEKGERNKEIIDHRNLACLYINNTTPRYKWTKLLVHI